MKHPDGPMSAQLLDLKALSRLLSMSGRKIRILAAKGEFPQPVRIGRAIRWRSSEVDEYVKSLK